MSDAPAGVRRGRLEKAASDNGFDLDRGGDGRWLYFGSSHANLDLWLTDWAGATLIAAFSHPGVVASLGEHGVPVSQPVPVGACGARSVTDFAQLHTLLQRASLLANALPTALWETFAERTRALPRSMEAERLVVQTRIDRSQTRIDRSRPDRQESGTARHTAHLRRSASTPRAGCGFQDATLRPCDKAPGGPWWRGC